jgi:hypothetical protein
VCARARPGTRFTAYVLAGARACCRVLERYGAISGEPCAPQYDDAALAHASRPPAGMLLPSSYVGCGRSYTGRQPRPSWTRIFSYTWTHLGCLVRGGACFVAARSGSFSLLLLLLLLLLLPPPLLLVAASHSFRVSGQAAVMSIIRLTDPAVMDVVKNSRAAKFLSSRCAPRRVRFLTRSWHHMMRSACPRLCAQIRVLQMAVGRGGRWGACVVSVCASCSRFASGLVTRLLAVCRLREFSLRARPRWRCWPQ